MSRLCCPYSLTKVEYKCCRNEIRHLTTFVVFLPGSILACIILAYPVETNPFHWDELNQWEQPIILWGVQAKYTHAVVSKVNLPTSTEVSTVLFSILRALAVHEIKGNTSSVSTGHNTAYLQALGSRGTAGQMPWIHVDAQVQWTESFLTNLTGRLNTPWSPTVRP